MASSLWQSIKFTLPIINRFLEWETLNIRYIFFVCIEWNKTHFQFYEICLLRSFVLFRWMLFVTVNSFTIILEHILAHSQFMENIYTAIFILRWLIIIYNYYFHDVNAAAAAQHVIPYPLKPIPISFNFKYISLMMVLIMNLFLNLRSTFLLNAFPCSSVRSFYSYVLFMNSVKKVLHSNIHHREQ